VAAPPLGVPSTQTFPRTSYQTTDCCNECEHFVRLQTVTTQSGGIIGPVNSSIPGLNDQKIEIQDQSHGMGSGLDWSGKRVRRLDELKLAHRFN
jgi:hypothetical protein